MHRVVLASALLVVLCAGCARNLSSSVHTQSATTGKVVEGVIVSARAVTVKAHDKLADNTTGGLAGGVLGGVAGNSFGKGTGNAAATVGVGILGAVAGAFAEDALSTSDGIEYLVKISGKNPGKKTKKEVEITKANSVDRDIQKAVETEGIETDVIAVVQQDEQPFQAGQKVYVVFNDDRPRVIARN